MAVIISEVKTRKELKTFVQFGIDIFEGNDTLKDKFVVQKQSKYAISYITVLRPNGEQ